MIDVQPDFWNDPVLTKPLDPVDRPGGLSSLSSRIPGLRARAKHLLSGDPSVWPSKADLRDLIEDAWALEAELSAWDETLPQEWKSPKVVKSRFHTRYPPTQHLPCSLTWPYYDHLFVSPAVAYVISRNRIGRIYNLEVIAKCSNRDTEPLDEYLAAANVQVQLVLRKIADDICASVATFERTDRESDSDAPVLSEHIFMTLCAVLQLDCVPVTQRDWVRKCIDNVPEFNLEPEFLHMKHVRPNFFARPSADNDVGWV